MAEGGDCFENSHGRGRGLPFGKPMEREPLRRPFACPSNKSNMLNSPRNPAAAPTPAVDKMENCDNTKYGELASPHQSSNAVDAHHTNSVDFQKDAKVPTRTEFSTSALRVEAKEFVPRSKWTGDDVPRLITEETNQVESFQHDIYYHNEFMHYLNDHLNELSVDPGKYASLENSLLQLLLCYMTNEQTLKTVIDEIVSRSVTDPNLTYNGARLCNFLSQNILSEKGDKIFRSILLEKTSNEHRKAVTNPESDAWLRGLVHFIGELFIHLELGEGGTSARYEILSIVLREMLEKLLQRPTEENLKCVARVLKFAGAALEEDHRSLHKTGQMDELMGHIKELWKNNISRSAKEQFTTILNLRSSNWGQSISPSALQEDLSVGDFSCGEPVLYGPDGQPITREESQFLESMKTVYEGDDEYTDYPDMGPGEWSTEDDQMDDEMAAAFEEFLALHPGCSQYHNS